MNKIMLSINPIHVKNILNNTKKYEYRTKAAKRENISKIVVYSTNPVKKVVAELEIIKIIKQSPDDLWNQTKKESGITKEFFDNYFKNRKIAYAYKIGRVVIFKIPKSLKDYGLKSAPQSFCYV